MERFEGTVARLLKKLDKEGRLHTLSVETSMEIDAAISTILSSDPAPQARKRCAGRVAAAK